MERRRRVPRIRIHPEANAVEAGPNRRAHGDPAAEGGATTSAPFQSVPAGAAPAWVVGGRAMPLSR